MNVVKDCPFSSPHNSRYRLLVAKIEASLYGTVSLGISVAETINRSFLSGQALKQDRGGSEHVSTAEHSPIGPIVRDNDVPELRSSMTLISIYC